MALTRNPIMDGVQEDLSNLAYSFISAGKTDFTHFVKLWKSHNFCYIYSGRVSVKEVKHFTREILTMAKYLCSPKNSFIERVGGVYVMYSLYYIQPLKFPVRIRIDKDEFQELLHFVNGCNLLEVRYCFYKLFLDHAFDYVYSDKLYSLERMRDRDLEARQLTATATKDKMDLKGQLEQIWKAVDFDQNKWMETESAYNKIKASLNKLGDQSNFQMTEFLKPILTVEEKLDEHESNNKLSPPTAKGKREKPKRVKDAVNVLFEDPSSEEEDIMRGTQSMPQIDLNQSEEDEDEDDDASS